MTDSVTIRDDAVSARAISVACCDRGHIFVRLHDKKGDVFAYAAIDHDNASGIIDRLFDAIDGVGSTPCDRHPQ